MHVPTVISQRSRRALEGEAGSNVPIRRMAWPDEGRAAGTATPSPMCLATPGRAACIAIFVGFRLAAGASEVDAVYGPVCACHGREGAGVSCRSAEQDCKYKNRCKYKTPKRKHFKIQRQCFSNADSLLLVHNPPSYSFKRFYIGENKPRRTQFSDLTQSAPGLQKDVSKEQ